MGAFANMMFHALLGWVRTAVSWLWQLISGAQSSGWMSWLIENWLALILILCAVGLVIDFVIYLLRWQPYRVWGGFLRRFTERRKLAAERAAEEAAFQRQWVFADGSTAPEAPEITKKKSRRKKEEALNQPIRPVRRVARYNTLEESYHQPVYPPQWGQNPQQDQGDNE